MTDHPITPPPELAAKWVHEIYGNTVVIPLQQPTLDVIARAAQWGADQELEACIAWFDKHIPGYELVADRLRAARRPTPPSLKEQALKAAHIELDPQGRNGSLIIRALEALPDD